MNGDLLTTEYKQYEHTTRDVSNSTRRNPRLKDRASAGLSRKLDETLETQSSETADFGQGGLQYSDTAYNTLKAENQALRTENDCLKRDLADARIKLDEAARTIQSLEDKVRLLEPQRQVSQESSDMPRASRNLFLRSNSGASSIGALTVTQEQFYTPSSSHDIDLIRTRPDYASDPATPIPPPKGATSTDYTVLRHFDVDAIKLVSPSACTDTASAHANAHFGNEAFVERGDTAQQLASSEGSYTPHHPRALEDGAQQRQLTSLRSSVRHGSLKRKSISTGEIAPVERPSRRQRLFTDEHEPLVQRFASPSPPAQLITPSDTTVERSHKRKHMSLDDPALTDHPAKRLHRSLRAVAHAGTNMDTPGSNQNR
ncbi:hypothetical protein LTR74_016750 [Friedmanniomyces endolithicus]|nr:hypothetical protein LTR74_016750 [Friedmanniomyces endolithicus]